MHTPVPGSGSRFLSWIQSSPTKTAPGKRIPYSESDAIREGEREFAHKELLYVALMLPDITIEYVTGFQESLGHIPAASSEGLGILRV